MNVIDEVKDGNFNYSNGVDRFKICSGNRRKRICLWFYVKSKELKMTPVYLT